jgi:drug/metabolite transporter (DMT)-like permease
MLPALLTTVLFSLSAIFGGRVSRMIGGTEANFWRLSVGTVFLGLFAFTLGNGLDGAAFPWLLFSGFIGFGIGDLAWFQALPRIGSRLGLLMVNCIAAPVASLIDWLWLGTTLTPLQMACSLVILSGVALAVAPKKGAQPHGPEFSKGAVFGLVAAAAQGAGAVLSRKAFTVAAEAGDPLDGMTAAFQRIVAGVALSGLLLLWFKRHHIAAGIARQDAPRPPRERPPFKTIAPWVVLNALAGPALGVSCFQWALKNHPTGLILPIVATAPIVVIPFSWWIDGDRPTVRSVVGGVIAVAGVVGLTMVPR